LPLDRSPEKIPNGFYRVRLQNSSINKGLSGGYRVIYYIQTPEAILLTKIYSKSDREDISNEEVEDIIKEYESEIDSSKGMLRKGQQESTEEEREMPYVTSIEQMGIERERQKIALKMLQENIPLETVARITELTIEQLQQLQ
jgi:hypothetical protein